MTLRVMDFQVQCFRQKVLLWLDLDKDDESCGIAEMTVQVVIGTLHKSFIGLLTRREARNLATDLEQ